MGIKDKYPNHNGGKTTPCYIFDIDGTLADISHRLHHIKDGNKNWDAFFDDCDKDTPIQHIAKLVELFGEKHEIVLVSGRSDRVRDKTIKWLNDNAIGYTKLYMRPNKDHRPDYAMKKILLEQLLADGFDPLMAFDDRDQVVKMWREQGIPCCQVADGDF